MAKTTSSGSTEVRRYVYPGPHPEIVLIGVGVFRRGVAVPLDPATGDGLVRRGKLRSAEAVAGPAQPAE